MRRILFKKKYTFPYIYVKIIELTTNNKFIPFANDYEIPLSQEYLKEIKNLLNTYYGNCKINENEYKGFLESYNIDVTFGILNQKNVICLRFNDGYLDNCSYKVHEITFDSCKNMSFSVNYTRYKDDPGIIPHSSNNLIT
jgi:hypothetical protein